MLSVVFSWFSEVTGGSWQIIPVGFLKLPVVLTRLSMVLSVFSVLPVVLNRLSVVFSWFPQVTSGSRQVISGSQLVL